ncbi:MAG: GspH/FimT family pseudopilin [Gammaproteobacteria bacterium]
MDDHRQSGYSLFELIITLALASIFAGLAAPSFAEYIDTSRLRSATEAIASDFRKTRILAIQSGQNQYINFQNTGSNWCYSIATETSKACDRSGGSSADFSRIKLDKVAFGNKPSIAFSPLRGSARNGRITLSTASGKSASVIVSPLGRIRTCSSQTTGYTPC